MIKIIRCNQYFLIASVELIAGAILLTCEIRDFIRLPTTTEADEMYGGLVNLFKYQENTYCLLYLWSILLFAGVSYWINRKLHWIFNKIVLITIFLAAVLTPEHILPWYFDRNILILFLVIPLIFIWLFRRLHEKSYLKTIGMSSRMKWLSTYLAVLLSVIYFVLFLFW